MSISVDVVSDGVRVPLSRVRLAALVRRVLRAERVKTATISLTFVTRAAMARLNRRHLGHSGPTDVISFALAPVVDGGPVVGDIYISAEVARDNAQRHGCGVREELARLVVHGVLHVLGHDHPEGDRREESPMWQTQERLLKRWMVSEAA